MEFFFDWSRRGNRTRLDVVRWHTLETKDNFKSVRYSLEYGSPQEFITKMRGLSVFILENWSLQILGFDNYNLSTAVTPAPVPANFTKVTRVVTQGGVPSGGYYFANAPVTQREYEAVMQQNPSRVKNPSQPVNNVSIVNAMVFCNQMSIRDGLEPAYIIEYEAAHGGLFSFESYPESLNSVTLDNFASGYRLPTSSEWTFALTNGVVGMGVSADYVFDGAFDRRRASFMAYSQAGRREARKFVPGIMTELISVFEGSVEINKQIGLWVGEPPEMPPTDPYEQDLGVSRDGRFKRFRITPAIRLVRPVFDYWKYTTGE
jgi:hypothetical protein